MAYRQSCVSDYVIDAGRMKYGERMVVFGEKTGQQAANITVWTMQRALDAQYGELQYRVWAHGTMRYVDKRLGP
jgi:hypothetical protein